MPRRQSGKVSSQLSHRPDYIIALLVLALIGIGLIMIYATGSIVTFNISGGTSDSNGFFVTQLSVLIIGLFVWYATSKIHYSFWRKASLYLFIFSVILMLIAIIPGISYSANGATRWLKIAGVSFQPVELFKLALVLYLSAWVEKNKENLRSISLGLLPFLAIIAISATFVMVLQRDMGSAMVIVLSTLVIWFLAAGPLWIFFTGLGTIGAGLLMMIMLFPYRLERVKTFFNHQDDPSGSGYHIKQALIAIGSGGIIGRGLGNSFQSYGYLPESTNDSIFAIIGEQFGLVGTSFVASLFAILGWRGYQISKAAPDTFSRLVAAGITSWIVFQAIINICAMLNLIPLTGIPLPFISNGGSSLLVNLAAIGILQNISRFTFKEVSYANRSFGWGNRRSYRASAGNARRIKTAR